MEREGGGRSDLGCGPKQWGSLSSQLYRTLSSFWDSLKSVKLVLVLVSRLGMGVIILQWPLWRDLLVREATQSPGLQKSQALAAGLAVVTPRLGVLGISAGSRGAWRWPAGGRGFQMWGRNGQFPFQSVPFMRCYLDKYVFGIRFASSWAASWKWKKKSLICPRSSGPGWALLQRCSSTEPAGAGGLSRAPAGQRASACSVGRARPCSLS